MLKNRLNFAFFSLILLGAVSCDKDDDTDDPNQSTDPVTLECDIDEMTVLENRNDGIDYIVPCLIDVTAGLVIEPGVTIAFEQGAGFEIQDYGTREGYIEAVGTEEDSITFTGVLQAAGAWRNISINSEDLRNTMAYCIIEYAGHSDGSEAAVDLDKSSKLEIKNTSFRNNKGYGLFVRNSSNIEGYESNRFADNQYYPIHIAANKIMYLDGVESDYTGNTNNEIYVFSNSIYDRGFVEGEDVHEWLNPGIPFFINEDVKAGQREYVHLKIMEGTHLRFGDGWGLQVEQNNAILEILGTPNNIVTLSGTNGQGSWTGVWLNTSNSQNKIENAIIKDGGQSTAGHWFDNPANLSLGYSGAVVNLELNNVELNNSGGCGIAETGTINLTTDNVSFNNNAGNDYCD